MTEPGSNGWIAAEIRALVKAHPDITKPEIARSLGVSRQRIYQACSDYSIEVAAATRAKKTDVPRRPRQIVHDDGREVWLNKFGYEGRIAPSWSGAIAEMTVAIDLAKRGLHVYHSVARTGPFDLVVYDGQNLRRVEVKSISDPDGFPSNLDTSRFDILALVDADGGVRYTPDPFIREGSAE